MMIVWLATLQVWGVQAYSVPVDVKQADGTMLTIVLHGDEDFNYYTTLDGVLLVQQDGSYFVASIDESGQATATSLLAHNASLRSPEEKALASKQQMTLFLNTGNKRAGMRRVQREPVRDDHTLFPHTGTPKAIVILAEYNDTIPYSHFTIENPKQSFHDYFNKLGNLPDYGRGESANLSSVRQYFKAASFGQYMPEFDVFGPVMVPSAMETYGGASSNGNDENIKQLVKDACVLMDDSLDFSQYDANEDGYVDLVIIIYAGYSQSVTGNATSCLWPKSGNCSGGKYDGKNISRFGINAELNGFPGCYSSAPYERINGIGTLCHEFSHCLGLPDFYPTGNAWKGDNQAMEFWSIMDSGNYLSNGNAPAAFTAWEREALEWMEIPTLTEAGDLEIAPIDYDGTAYRIVNDNDETGNEYFIIENIQTRGYNQRQKGHGLLVYHVNYNAAAFSLASNSVNNQKGKPRMTVVPADGLLFAQYNIDGVNVKNSDFYEQLAGDPYPGSTMRTELNDTIGVVNFQVYNGDRLNKALDNITEVDGKIRLTFINDFQQHLDGIAEVVTTSDRASGHDFIYTLDGRIAGRDLMALPKGLYIRNGKKVVRGER